MATLTAQIVRPDRLVWEGAVEHLVLHTRTGEMGVYPLHAPAIVALGDGVSRMHLAENPSEARRVIISGGYAQVMPDEVIILADHARLTDDVDAETVNKTKAEAEAKLAALDPDDHRRLYWTEKVHWCDLLLQHGEY